MHIIIAPNAFKGSLTAQEAAECIAAGLKQSSLLCQLTIFPIADGGDGTATLIAQKMGSELSKTIVHDPLGRKIEAGFGWIEKSKTAIIEMSEASGLRLLKTDELNPLKANTKGTGDLIKAALVKGAGEIIICVGGSATVDGGAGMLSVLGVRFLDENKQEITDFPKGLVSLKFIETKELDPRLKQCRLIVLCDVKNKLFGENGAAVVFGPQKGADEKQVIFLEKCLKQYNEIIRQHLKKDMSSFIYGGAAGGVAASLCAFLGADLVSGIDFFLDTMGFEKLLKSADLVITGEGSLDEQTLEGKARLV